MTDSNLNLNILGEIRYLGIPDIIDYKLNGMNQKFKTTDLIWRTELRIINRFG